MNSGRLQGMFSFTGLNPDQTKKLVEEHSVYLTGEYSLMSLVPGAVER